MKKRVAQWIGGGLLSLISILIYLFLFQTHLFSQLTLNLLNSTFLESRDISVHGQLHGGVFGKELGISNLNVLLNNNADTLLVAEAAKLIDWEWEWDTREVFIKNFTIDDYHFRSEFIPVRSGKAPESPTLTSVIIENIRGNNGRLDLVVQDSMQVVNLLNMTANLWLIDGFTHLKILSSEIAIPDISADTMSISGTLEADQSGALAFNDLQVNSPSQSLKLDGTMGTESISIKLDAKDVAISSIEYLELPEPYSNARMDFSLNFQKDSTDLHLSGTGSLHMADNQIPIKLNSFAHTNGGDEINVIIGDELEHIAISAERDTIGRVSGYADLFRLDLSPFLINSKLLIREPIGQISFSGRDGTYLFNPRLATFTMNDIKFDSLVADVRYANGRDLWFPKGLITMGDNRLEFSGGINTDVLNLQGALSISDFSLIQPLEKKNPFGGAVASNFVVSGSLDRPQISGDISPDNLSFDDKLMLTGLGKVALVLEQGKLLGDVALQGNQGLLLGDSLLSYTVLANVSSLGISIDDLHLQGTKNLISLSGRSDSEGIDIHKLNVIMGGDQLKLADSIHIEKRTDSLFEIPSSIFSFNNGGLALAGAYDLNQGLQLSSNFELIDVQGILDFFNLKVAFAGIATGKAQLTGPLFDPVIDAQFQLLNGVTLGYPSDSAMVDITLSSSTTVSNAMYASKSGGTLNLVGQLPWGYKIKGDAIKTTPQNFSIVTDNYRLRDLKFKTIVGMPVNGRATGSLSIRGTPVDTKMDAQLSLTEAAFDTLKFTSGYMEMNYEGNLLTFDTLSMVSNWGYGSGSGFMPLSLDLIAGDRSSFSSRDMGMDFEFNLNEMPFLSSYIASIDGIQGDFIGNLGFSGPLKAPIRNGKIRGHNGRLEVSVLGNPVTDIHSELTLVDNTMTLDHFSGRMLFSEGSNLNIQGVVGEITSYFGDLFGVDATQNYAGTVNAQGTIDLRSFFHPRFDISLNAEEVYYRSTDGLIEAIADAELQFIGQDTMDVTAIIPVKRAAYYDNFGEKESYDEIVSNVDSSIFRYSLDTQFASDLLISNDQIEAEFEGELWLLDYGDGIMRFTGTLTVQEGGKFYYLGNELRLNSGEIIFNSVDFNPQINMEAEIDIDGETIVLVLSGDLLEPELVIKAANTQLTQSDVLTYLTINQKLVEVSFDTQSALNPVKSYSEMLVEKQLSKVAREITGLDILDVGLNTSDTSSVSRLQLGQRITKNWKVTYDGALQPIDGKSDYDFGLEYQINQNVSVTSKINQDGEVELNGRLKFTY